MTRITSEWLWRKKRYNVEVKASDRTWRLHMMAHSLEDTWPVCASSSSSSPFSTSTWVLVTFLLAWLHSWLLAVTIDQRKKREFTAAFRITGSQFVCSHVTHWPSGSGRCSTSCTVSERWSWTSGTTTSACRWPQGPYSESTCMGSCCASCSWQVHSWSGDWFPSVLSRWQFQPYWKLSRCLWMWGMKHQCRA